MQLYSKVGRADVSLSSPAALMYWSDAPIESKPNISATQNINTLKATIPTGMATIVTVASNQISISEKRKRDALATNNAIIVAH